MRHDYHVLLRQAREARGWAQKDVAEQIGTDSKTVSRWERGEAYPSPYFRQKLSSLFVQSLAELGLLPEKKTDLPDHPQPAPLPAPTSLPAPPPQPAQFHDTATRQDQNDARMLGRLRRSYSELLAHSLEQITWIELGLAGMPNAVQNAINRLVHWTRQHAQPLPPGTSILDVFEMSERELLILGEPGAGKSTLLLHLALALVQRAGQEATQPLPIILRLSSWAEHQPPLEDWICEQLTLTYDVPQQLSAQWVLEEHILPLLDGLDEMDSASRQACIAAINAYHGEHIGPLVIASRLAEYEDASRQQTLTLQFAVLIQPLTLDQIHDALDRIGQPLAGLKAELKTNTALQEVISTPLMLSIVMLTYSGTSGHGLSRQASTLQREVWTDYVERMLDQKGDSQYYPPQQTRSWLSWLARNLRKHQQPVFYLEHLQSDWLPRKLKRTAFWLTIYIPIILLGMLSSLMIGLLLQTVIDMTTGIQAAILGGMLGIAFWQSAYSSAHGGARSMRPGKSRRRHLRNVALSAGAGLSIALSFGFEQVAVLGEPAYSLRDWLRDGGIYGSIIGLGCWLLLDWLPTSSRERRVARARQNTHTLQQLFSTLHARRIVLGATVLGLGYGLSTWLSYGSRYGLSVALNFGLSYGYVTFLITLHSRKGRDTSRIRAGSAS